MNPAYTRALPVSLSATITSIGRPIIAAAMRKSLGRLILNHCWLITSDRSSEVVIFETSAGWKRIGPRSNHECDPFTSEETNITSTRSPSTKA